MPNGCSTNYAFQGKRKDILDFYSKIDKFISEECLSNGFGNSWLGNILNGFGFDVETCEIQHRGLVTYLNLNDISEGINPIIMLSTETA